MSRSPWIDEVSARSVREMAQHLGLERVKGDTWACPACLAGARGSGDKRGAVGRARSGRGWSCHRCGAKGDGADLASWVKFQKPVKALDAEQRRELRGHLAQMGLCTGRWTYQQAPLRAQLPVQEQEPEIDGPLPEEVQALWDVCTHPMEDRAVREYSAGRGWGAGLQELGDSGTMRVTPSPLWKGWPWWWPRGRARCWRMVTRVWSPRGELLGLHGRAVGETPVVEGRALPKALGHRMRGPGWMMSGYLRWNLEHACLTRALVCEGVADFWALASVPDAGPQFGGVLGGISGSFKSLGEFRWASGAKIVLMTHDDKAGDLYAQQAAESLAGQRVRLFRARLGGAA